jgi:hypothetical protein
LWGLQVVSSPVVTQPIVMDTSVLTLHLDAATFAVDPFTGFSTNVSQARLEAPAVLVVRQGDGIYMNTFS